jgi:short-subunit dehydrogenase
MTSITSTDKRGDRAKLNLKPLKRQTIVITGASSGIGLVTARLAAKRGARVVLAARNKNALMQLTEEIRRQGGEAEHIQADVGHEEEMQAIARLAQDRFGGFDTWINNAGVSTYGRLLDVSIEDHRHLFETNFWGLVYGSLEAARHLRTRGGALINIGSTLSDRAVPLQGMYSASKHAVKGFTDALRMELENEKAPVSVTLIKPGAIDTPYTRHAKNYLDFQPKNPPPVYAPDIVAETILYCAEHPVRDMFVGSGGKMTSMMGQYAPRLTDKIMEWFFIPAQQTRHPEPDQRTNSLYESSGDMHERGGYNGHVGETSFYTQATRHPVLTGAALAGAALALSALWRDSHNGGQSHESGRYASRMTPPSC